jgi:hypothetical protein
MALTTVSQQKVLKKSRNRIYGKKRSHDAILKEIVNLALRGTEPTSIAEIIGKSRPTVWRYLDEATKLGLVSITVLSSSPRLVKPLSIIVIEALLSIILLSSVYLSTSL